MAMCITLRYAPTRPPPKPTRSRYYKPAISYAVATRCPVLTSATRLPMWAIEDSPVGERRYETTLYRPTRVLCPVLTCTCYESVEY
eukprot:2941004-Rhodomonas_salina.2